MITVKTWVQVYHITNTNTKYLVIKLECVYYFKNKLKHNTFLISINTRYLSCCSNERRFFISGCWQVPEAVLHKGPKDMGYCQSRAQRARDWLKRVSPRAQGQAKLSVRFDACQCYYMFFTTQLKIANFTAY